MTSFATCTIGLVILLSLVACSSSPPPAVTPPITSPITGEREGVLL